MLKKKKRKPVTDVCLLLKTPDNRMFFTHENNLPLIIEFGRTFGAEISLVKAKEAPVLELEELARLICAPTESKEGTEYTVLEVKLSPDEKIVANKNEDALKAGEYAKTELLQGRKITLKDLASKFPEAKPKMSELLGKVRRELSKDGYRIVKEAPGQYRLLSIYDE